MIFLRILLPIFLLSFLSCQKQSTEIKQDLIKSEVITNPVDSFPKLEPVVTDSTTENHFDETKWKAKKGLDYPYRPQLYKDLLYNPKYRTLQKEEILELLGKPDRIDGNYLFYKISQKRLSTWILGGKTLVFKFTDENEIEWIKIHE